MIRPCPCVNDSDCTRTNPMSPALTDLSLPLRLFLSPLPHSPLPHPRQWHTGFLFPDALASLLHEDASLEFSRLEINSHTSLQLFSPLSSDRSQLKYHNLKEVSMLAWVPQKVKPKARACWAIILMRKTIQGAGGRNMKERYRGGGRANVQMCWPSPNATDVLICKTTSPTSQMDCVMGPSFTGKQKGDILRLLSPDAQRFPHGRLTPPAFLGSACGAMGAEKASWEHHRAAPEQEARDVRYRLGAVCCQVAPA